MKQMIESLYIHIPFCKQICHYCDFNKVYYDKQPVMAYLEALRQELITTLEIFPTKKIKTIFIGGGTPTALSMGELAFLLETIHSFVSVPDVIEFSVEANPNEVTKEKLQLLKQAGVNRMSFGVQAFQDELLRTLGRTHRKKEVFRTLEVAHQVGIDQLSIDLMFGLPKQTLADVKESLQTAFQLPISHLSSYSLQIEPKTIFYVLHQKGKLARMSEELEANMYELVMEEAENHHFHQYEISNFAKENKVSHHNLTYWNNDEYYGIGAGAHSYMNGVRRSNIGPIQKYIDAIQAEKHAYIEEMMLTKKEMMEEFMFMGLRKRKGVSKKEFFLRYGEEIETYFQQPIDEMAARGLLAQTNDFIHLTKKGMFLGNEVFEQFLL